jgi:hypothetical protein
MMLARGIGRGRKPVLGQTSTVRAPNDHIIELESLRLLSVHKD